MTAYLKIKRQSAPKSNPYWESFSVECEEDDTVLSLLDRIEGTAAIHHECNCKEEMCGVCTIRINGKPRLACSTLVKNLPRSSCKKPIILEPLEKFPVIKDLTVDRSRIAHSLSQIKNWVETDHLFDSKMEYEQKVQQEMYSYTKCINCGSCYDACPRTSMAESRYIGPSSIARVVAMNDHPLGRENSEERLDSITGNDGISQCGKSMKCEKVCPKGVPLVRSLTRANREAFSKIFR